MAKCQHSTCYMERFTKKMSLFLEFQTVDNVNTYVAHQMVLSVIKCRTTLSYAGKIAGIIHDCHINIFDVWIQLLSQVVNVIEKQLQMRVHFKTKSIEHIC